MKADFLSIIKSNILNSVHTPENPLAAININLDWLDNLPVKIIIADAAGKAEYWSRQWYEYTGLPLDYPINALWKAALHPDDIQRTYKAMNYSVRTGSNLQIEYRLKRAADGQFRWHVAKACSTKNNDNTINKWLVAVTDIHEQKEAEQRKDTFLGIAAHELKTPLTSLKTLLHVYKNEVMAESETCPVLLEQAENQLLRIERLLCNLMDVSKANPYTMVYRLEEFNFSELMKESVARMQQQTSRHTIVLEKNAKVLFTGDRLRLEQVIDNLLSNAIKYSPNAKQIIVQSYIIENDLYVSVQDFGVGIASENLNNIYQAFYRANNTAKDVQGLGMGLYICSEIIKNHHGDIWAHSIPAKGSVFYIRLPISGHCNLVQQ